MKIYFIVCLAITSVLARDDGLVLTPPMGWLSWTRYACEIDCVKYPKSCINEDLYKEQADRLAADGFKELGYNYVNIDDCWSEMQRDGNKRLVADKKRFPNGIKALADYVHSKGLKLGIYGDVGPKTCAGYPSQNGVNGSNYFTIDAKTFAEWGVDSFKFDGCNEDPKHFDDLFPKMGKALNESGRQMVYICEWPLYQHFHNPPIAVNYEAVAKTCHVFRNFGDIADSWSSIESTINFYGDNYDMFSKYQGPGHFFDPDMIVVGDYGIAYHHARTQMAMWSMFSAPLYMSNDLRQLSAEDKKILQNKAIIAINQDKNAFMAKRISNSGGQQVWTKRVEPQVNGQWSYAVVYIDTNGIGDKRYISKKVSELAIDAKNGTQYTVYDLYLDDGKEVLATLKTTDSLELLVATGGGCRVTKLVPNK
ncbi:alpha-N-acetylgalactosaminidase-like [Oppia nitens]|uniref:alpha-N-acetylgalactosaminidase-like n=1 Tax=Oppia nitens TaxID=1686743 RepID=UPI0023DA597F|nr:alpha-N-acetylgalactosaminidase-like [Oppia nitens]